MHLDGGISKNRKQNMTKNNLTQFYRRIGAMLIVGMLIASPVGPAFAEEVSTNFDTTTPSVDLLPEEQNADVSTSTRDTSLEARATATSSNQSSSDSESSATSTDVTSSTTTLASIDCSTTSSKEISFSTESQGNTAPATSTENSTTTMAVDSKTDCRMSPSTDQTLTTATSTDPEAMSSATSSLVLDIFTKSDESISTTTATTGPVILSGKAVAEANILNIANTDIVNSSGNIVFTNLTDNKKGAVDLRGVGGTSTCSIASCVGNSDIEMNILDNAHIANYIQLSADSGDNTIVAEGDAVIQTGDAIAALNLVNIANVNLIGSQYLIVALNAFKGVDGDIIFPNLDKFFNAGTVPASSLTLSNTGAIVNDVALIADSGGNAITAASSTINAGDAHATSNIYNQLNSTLGANDMVSILFNVHGAWNGKLVNAPLGLMSSSTLDGSYFFTSPYYPTTLPFGGTSTNTQYGGSLDLTGTSTALIENNVDINALSGNNSILSTGSGLISSGKAYAGANIINIANASVIGKNWLLAIVNIFGDFNGDITFGRPDLWVGDRVETPPPFLNGKEMTYRFTVINKGDAPSSKVILSDTLDTAHLDIVRSSLPYHQSKSNELVWELGDVPQGKAIELTLTARIKNDLREGTSIENRVSVRGTEAESITENNSDINVIKTYITPSGGSSGGGGTIILMTPNNAGSVTTTTSGSTSASSQATSSTTTSMTLPIDITRATATTTINDVNVKSSQNIIIKNPNNEKITSVTFHDILLSPSGAVVKDEEWELGTLLPHEEVTIGYDIAFNTNATSGVYFLSSTISRPKMQDSVYGVNGAIVLSGRSAIHTAQFMSPTTHTVTKVLQRDSSVMGAVASAAGGILTETAYAANESDIPPTGHDGQSVAFLILFFMPMLITILFISIRKHKMMKYK